MSDRTSTTTRPIIFFGTEEALAVTPLTKLLESKYHITAIFTAPDNKAGRGQKLTAPKIKEIGLSHHIPVFQPEKSQEIRQILTTLTDEKLEITRPIGVLVGYGKIIPQSVLDWFEPLGIVNLHPSLLPKYRGPSPIETAILNGDHATGISLIRLTANMDAGAIYVQKKLALGGKETKKELYAKLSELGTESLLAILPELPHFLATAQDETKASYCQKLDKSMSELKPREKTARELYNQIRAFLSFPKSKLNLCGINCVITMADVAEHPQTELDLKCQDGNYLIINRLIPEGRKEMTARDFLNGLH
ncbi:MAG: methionyl-tRNA formyltransferase [Candidatus Nomurabacteria bacterium]|jgi:methionyl-tRNA formyltransferase|nr:methionyl-tRNA formyltransferase [Candidatus Nomurabacteria bacterium]